MGRSASRASTADRTSPRPARVPERFSNLERSSSTACHMPSMLGPPKPPIGCELRMLLSLVDHERYLTIHPDIREKQWLRTHDPGSRSRSTCQGPPTE